MPPKKAAPGGVMRRKAPKTEPPVEEPPKVEEEEEEEEELISISEEEEEEEEGEEAEEEEEEEKEGGEVDGGVPEGEMELPDEDEESEEEDSYSSDEEVGHLVRTGDVPLEWYKDTDHAGYDVEGNKIMKEKRDALSELLTKVDTPEEMMAVYEKLTGKRHVLTKEDIQTLLNLQSNKYPDSSFNPYPEYVDFVKWDQNPFDKGTPAKRRFQPSRTEMKMVSKLVRKLRRLEKNPPPKKEDKDAPYQLWNEGDAIDPTVAKRRSWLIGPPKKPPPSTKESYNPPLEYLMTTEELEQANAEEPVDRPEFVPQKFDALRKVPWYRNTLRERYQRCLDLFMFARKKKMKTNVVPDSLLPQDLPRPEELRPFPQKLGLVYRGHTAPVRHVSVSPNGEYLATACDDHFARVFEVTTGRLVTKFNLKAPVSCVGWSPNPAFNILAMSADKVITFAVPKPCAVDLVNEASVEFLRQGLKGNAEGTAAEAMTLVSKMGDDMEDDTAADIDQTLDEEDAGNKELISWREADEAELRRGVVVKAVRHFRIQTFAWHVKGDYVASLSNRDRKSRQIVLIQISLRSSLAPFRRFKETVHCLSFHPTQPYLLVATQRTIRMYDLVQSRLVKKLSGTVDSISGIDMHPDGDNLIASSHDSHVMWYDLDYSERPYKKLTSHKLAVHTARYHPSTNVYPLFASAGDNGEIHVFHGRVYDDLTKNALIVPLKIIKGHKVKSSVGVLHIAFHPSLPWLFSAGADGTVKCWVE